MAEDEVPFDASDRTAVRKRNRQLKQTAEERDAAMRFMLSRPETRAFWWELLSQCGVFRADPLEVNTMFFSAGQRNIGLTLMAVIPPDLYALMANEANSTEKKDA